METLECCRVLKLPPDADERQIRAAFRRAVKRVHPDAYEGGERDGDALRRIVVAYHTLLRQLEEPSPEATETPRRPTSSPEEAAARTFCAPRAKRRNAPIFRRNTGQALELELDALPFPELCARFFAATNRQFRAAAARALARRRDARAIRTLTAALDCEEDRVVKVEIVRSLGRSGSRRAIHCLAGLLEDSDPRIAQAARTALGRLDSFRCRHALLSPRSPRWLRRLAAWLRL